jgi:P-type Cu2+ transporter
VSTAALSHVEWLDAAQQRAHAIFSVDGIRCAGCARTIDRALTQLDGLHAVRVNTATRRISVEFDPTRLSLAAVLSAVEAAGFKPVPLAGSGAVQAHATERREAIKRLGVAGLGMMQTMMLVFAFYTAGPRGIDASYAHYFQLVSMLLTLPVIFYSGAPILAGALANLRARTLGMDVPVALAVLLAFAASVYHTLQGSGETYYDSITMFIFFLLGGRFVEMNVRHASIDTNDALARSLPEHAQRLAADGSTERIPLNEIVPGDRLQIPRGAVFPVDGIASECVSIDQSLLTGESASVDVPAGELIAGGAVNAGKVAVVTARGRVNDSTLATIVRLLERAQRDRPPIARAADQIAKWFVLAILLLTVVVAAVWWWVDPSRAFTAVLAVLVVTCPCALSLATPVAIAAATTRMSRDGVLITRADAIERMSRVTTVVLDKTGTLTDPAQTGVTATALGSVSASDAVRIAAALERGSEHPLAQAFREYADPTMLASDVIETPGSGIEGTVDGVRYRLGRPSFVAGNDACDAAHRDSGAALVLGAGARSVAEFTVGDAVKPTARAATIALRALGLELAIASGDQPSRVARVATQLGIDDAVGELTPAGKISYVAALRQRGANVLMLGDGINDGPVLATADVSCAMAQGSALAQAAADCLIVDQSLRALPKAIETARRMQVVMRQNLTWAFAYNIAAVPAAALGMVPPWLAALGMSLSSLAVVLNARRLTHS